MQPLLLVRHAAASGQEPTAALTVESYRQAELLTDVLWPFEIERVVSSPFVRAVDSIAPFCERANLSLETDDRLAERVLSGQDLPDWRAHLRQSFDDPDYRLDGGESARTAQARGLAALHAVLASGERAVVVTHGNLLALLLQSIDPTFGYDRWAALSNPDVFLLHGEAGRRLAERLGPMGFMARELPAEFPGLMRGV